MRLLSTVLITTFVVSSSLAHEPDLERGQPFGAIEKLEFFKTGDPLVDYQSIRTFTAEDGRPLKAKLLSASHDSATFLLASTRKKATVRVDRFAEEDRRFIREWHLVSTFFNPNYVPSRNVTNQVQSDLMDGAFAQDGKIHETRHFRFESDVAIDKVVVKDFSQLFEATWYALAESPLAIAPAVPENGKFLVRLFSHIEDYREAGGPADSAGVYMLEEKVIMIPFSSLGLERNSKGRVAKANDYDPRTLIHETTHALTDQWLPYMPMWVAEGLAEYMAAIPYRNGTLDLNKHEEGMRELMRKKFGGDENRFGLFEPQDFVSLNHGQFMNLAGEESPIVLEKVEPVQIRLAGDPGSDHTLPMNSSPPEIPTINIPVQSRPEDVVRRYSSSMLLVHHLIRTGQAENFRKYLFDYLIFEDAGSRYIDNYNSALVQHQAEVQKQISDFEQSINDYNAAIDERNDAIRSLNAGELAKNEVPASPDNLVTPEAVPVPEILANPRVPEDFSRKAFLEKIAEKHLDLPLQLELP